MKAKRVDCGDCKNFIPPKQKEENNLISPIIVSAKCKLGKRVMFRMPNIAYSQMAQDSGGWFRYCGEFKKELLTKTNTMKIEKLELKHICGYLPWELTGCHKEGHICNIDFDMVVKYGTNLANYKPLILPLSALTEQLPDGTVPIVELAKMARKDISWGRTDGKNAISSNHVFGYWNGSFWLNNDGVSNQLQLFEYLYSKHFDIYGLIDSGLAIDKRTVKL